MPNAAAALLFSVRSTTHCVVFCRMPVFTEVTSGPSKTAGPSAYFMPLGSHDTIWLLVSSYWSAFRVYPTVAFQLSFTVVELGPGLHTSLLNSFSVAALTREALPYVVGVVAVELGDALALADGVADVLAFAVEVAVGLASRSDCALVDAFGLALVLGVAVELGLATGLGTAAPVYGSTRYTGRKAILAVVLTSLRTFSGGCPGIDTLIRSGPCCCTWAPELPVPFTRDSSTLIAWFIAPCVGTPFAVCAFSTTWVPLDRSSPRPTLNCCCHLAGWKVSLPVIAISMTRINTPSKASARTGRGPLLLGGATIASACRSSPSERAC